MPPLRLQWAPSSTVTKAAMGLGPWMGCVMSEEASGVLLQGLGEVAGTRNKRFGFQIEVCAKEG